MRLFDVCMAAVGYIEWIEFRVVEVKGGGLRLVLTVGGDKQAVHPSAEAEEFIVIDLLIGLLDVFLCEDDGGHILVAPVKGLVIGVSVGLYPFCKLAAGRGGVKLFLVLDYLQVAARPVDLEHIALGQGVKVDLAGICPAFYGGHDVFRPYHAAHIVLDGELITALGDKRLLIVELHPHKLFIEGLGIPEVYFVAVLLFKDLGKQRFLALIRQDILFLHAVVHFFRSDRRIFAFFDVAYEIAVDSNAAQALEEVCFLKTGIFFFAEKNRFYQFLEKPFNSSPNLHVLSPVYVKFRFFY